MSIDPSLVPIVIVPLLETPALFVLINVPPRILTVPEAFVRAALPLELPD